MNFGTQIAKILLYRNFDESKLTRQDFGRYLRFQNGRHLGHSAIFQEERQLESLEQA